MITERVNDKETKLLKLFAGREEDNMYKQLNEKLEKII